MKIGNFSGESGLIKKAGITLDEISGTQTSVFCGSFTNDYNAMTTKDLAQYPKYAVTGNGNAILSNRISYCYNLHGPSLTLDTACSSSLYVLFAITPFRMVLRFWRRKSLSRKRFFVSSS